MVRSLNSFQQSVPFSDAVPPIPFSVPAKSPSNARRLKEKSSLHSLIIEGVIVGVGVVDLVGVGVSLGVGVGVLVGVGVRVGVGVASGYEILYLNK